MSSEGGSMPQDLIAQLCNKYAKDDPVLYERLRKLAFYFLSSCSSIEFKDDDEPFVVSQIGQKLKGESPVQEKEFQTLYSQLLTNEIVQNRGAILKLLFLLSKAPKFTIKWGEDLEPVEKNTFKSDFSLSTKASQESIKSLFQGDTHLKSTQSSSTNIPSMLTLPSTSSSKTDLASGTSQQFCDYNLISDHEVLQNVIYALQGIEGPLFRKEVGDVGFVLDPKTCKTISMVDRALAERLLGMSFLHNKVKAFCDSNEHQSRLIDSALIAMLRDELSDYYKTIAVLQSRLDMRSLTLHKTLVYIFDHKTRFDWLAYIADECSEKKGGALISAVHGFLQHGSKCAKAVAEKVLSAVCKPLFIMLSRWLLDGEINDPCNEFFIEVRDVTVAERLWHDKYHVRRTMVPSFITMEQAQKILGTGKNINFLKQICKDSEQMHERDALRNLMKSSTANSLFSPERSLEFDSILKKVYQKTSLRVLDLLKNKHHLLQHFQALRNYLLLGQGDFIRHLLELLVPELNKSAQDISTHTLSAILESAIRDTNAQFEDDDTLSRFNVSFMTPSIGDTGWDVFSLIYIVDGPVGTVFQPYMSIYQSLFGALWKAKRMEFVLANMRKEQLAMGKKFRKIRELEPVTHVIHVLTSEMIHFSQQTQYYFLFEVLECSWAELQKQVNQAKCLDDIINAHNVFLKSVQTGVLLDENSRELFSHLRSIYNFILMLEKHQEVLIVAAQKEFDAYNALEAKSDAVGITTADEVGAKVRIEAFHHFLNVIHTELKHLSKNYEEFVKKYLMLLSSSSDMNLQLLSSRLNFNNFYFKAI